MELLPAGYLYALIALLLIFASEGARYSAVDSRARRLNPRVAPGRIEGSVCALRRILIPILDSSNLMPAIRHVVEEFMRGERMEVHLLHVRSPLSLHEIGRAHV